MSPPARDETTPALHLLCAGAARGLVAALAPAFEAAHGIRLDARFGAVGAMREALAHGAPCDAIVLTEALLATLGREGAVDAAATRALGRVATGVAVRRGDPMPAIGDAVALRAALAAAPRLHLPDTVRSTAGAHVLSVLATLGLVDATAPRRVEHPNGHAAMTALGESGIAGALGCTQVSEILHVPTVARVGPLPAAFALETPYSAGVARGAAVASLAAAFVRHLCAPEHADARRAAGFEAVPAA